MKFSIETAITITAIVLILGVRAVAVWADPKPSARPEDVYWDLRDMALHMKPEALGLNPTDDREPFAVVMDMDVNGKTATIISFATGDASLYVSTGGSVIGGGVSQDVASAAKKLVKAATSHLAVMTKVDRQPLPQAGQVIFYVVTREGIYSPGSRSQQALGDGQDSLSPLFYDGMEVLTQMRLLEESQTSRRR